MFRNWLFAVLALYCFSSSSAQDYLVVDLAAQPGRILKVEGSRSSLFWQRSHVNEPLFSKIRSLTFLADGEIAFCSGLDRGIRILGKGGERELHQGGYHARQVRTDTNGDLYWSAVETPQDNNPLQDGFIYRRVAKTGQVEALVTFSQALVGKDWWGAFDVRDGKIFVATLNSPSNLYQLENAIPKHIATLPFPVSSFRLTEGNSLLASDGKGQLLRVPDLKQPDKLEAALKLETAFADFTVAP